MLIDYNGKYNNMSTLAHELGPHDAELPVEQDAAVPAVELPDIRRGSIVNEARCSSTTCSQQHAAVESSREYLEGIKATVFRQTQFAEFELRMHELAQKGHR